MRRKNSKSCLPKNILAYNLFKNFAATFGVINNVLKFFFFCFLGFYVWPEIGLETQLVPAVGLVRLSISLARRSARLSEQLGHRAGSDHKLAAVVYLRPVTGLCQLGSTSLSYRALEQITHTVSADQLKQVIERHMLSQVFVAIEYPICDSGASNYLQYDSIGCHAQNLSVSFGVIWCVIFEVKIWPINLQL